MDNVTNAHVQYLDIYRHWTPKTEKYAGGDCLVTALDNGWKLDPIVRCEEHWHAGVRRVPVYHFTLIRGEERVMMPVISNPFVERFVTDPDLQVVRMNERRKIERKIGK